MAKKENEHTKYYNTRNQQVPSVTTIIKLLNKPELVNWANWMGFKKTKVDDILDFSSEIGTMTHDFIERFIRNGKINLNKIKTYYEYRDTPDIAIHCFDLFLEWLDDMKPRVSKFTGKRTGGEIKFLYSELQLSCDRYGGTIDCICTIDDTLYIIDFKTSSSIYPTMFLQLSAYVQLFMHNYPEYQIEKVAILRLDKKKKKYQFQEMDYADTLIYYEAFEGLLSVFRTWYLLGHVKF